MINTKFILLDGREVYPGYLDLEARKSIREQYAGEKEYLRCGCKPNEKLYYLISKDLKIYPAHNNYVHSALCCRYNDGSNRKRRYAYVVSDEDGEVMAYTSFDPKTFSVSETDDKESEPEDVDILDETMDEIVVDKTDDVEKDDSIKEPQLSLSQLVRSINVDTYMERILNNKCIDSRESFSKYVFHRMKKVRLSRAKKSIGEMTLEADGVKFFYLPYAGVISSTDNGISRCYLQTKGIGDEKVFKHFIYPKTMEGALKKFKKSYGIEPNNDTYVAGFQYIVSKRNGAKYKVIGRITLFQVSEKGLFCRNMTEVQVFNSLHNIVENDKSIRFWIPLEDENAGGVIDIKGKTKKILLLFPGKKSERVAFDSSVFTPLVATGPLSREMLYDV